MLSRLNSGCQSASRELPQLSKWTDKMRKKKQKVHCDESAVVSCKVRQSSITGQCLIHQGVPTCWIEQRGWTLRACLRDICLVLSLLIKKFQLFFFFLWWGHSWQRCRPCLNPLSGFRHTPVCSPSLFPPGSGDPEPTAVTDRSSLKHWRHFMR